MKVLETLGSRLELVDTDCIAFYARCFCCKHVMLAGGMYLCCEALGFGLNLSAPKIGCTVCISMSFSTFLRRTQSLVFKRSIPEPLLSAKLSGFQAASSILATL